MAFVGTKPVSVVETLFINHMSVTHVFGYLPPHGKSLAAAASKTFTGDFRREMNNRELAALQRDVDAGKCAYYVYTRHLLALPAATTPAIVAGAPVIWNTSNNNIEPASSTVWNADLATTQADFTNIFMGIAVQSKAGATAGQMVQVDISPETVREFTCASEAHEVDEFMSMDKDSGNALLPNTLEKAVAASSPFLIRRKDTAAATKVLCQWKSAFWGFNAAGTH